MIHEPGVIQMNKGFKHRTSLTTTQETISEATLGTELGT